MKHLRPKKKKPIQSKASAARAVGGARRVFEIITTSGKLMRAFLRVIRIKKVQLVLPIAAEDAAQTAIQYGKCKQQLAAL